MKIYISPVCDFAVHTQINCTVTYGGTKYKKLISTAEIYRNILLKMN